MLGSHTGRLEKAIAEFVAAADENIVDGLTALEGWLLKGSVEKVTAFCCGPARTA